MVPETPPFDMRRGLGILVQDFWFIGRPFDAYVYPGADYDTFCHEYLAFAVTSGADAGSASMPSSGPSASGPATFAGRRAVGSSFADETPTTLDPQAGSSSAGSAAGASSSSSSVLMSPQYWINDRVPVYGERLTYYDIPEVDRPLYALFPEDPGQVYLYLLKGFPYLFSRLIVLSFADTPGLGGTHI